VHADAGISSTVWNKSGEVCVGNKRRRRILLADHHKMVKESRDEVWKKLGDGSNYVASGNLQSYYYNTTTVNNSFPF
jgi:hypothetical protein